VDVGTSLVTSRCSIDAQVLMIGELVVVLMYVTLHPPSILNTSLVRMLTHEDLSHIQKNDFMATLAGAEWRATQSIKVLAPHIHGRSLSQLAVSQKAQVRQSDPHNTLQQRGNTSKARTIDFPDYLSARVSIKTTFQGVLELRPHQSLFECTSVSNISVGRLQTAIDKMKENASKLKHPPSSDKISDLKRACTAFLCALRQLETVRKRPQR
jgi:hypothetical protein